eukprot:GHVR01009939.1.p1 GENE.GHVR01009939.1~~GHVR01009939.1.p1  ORF type:complete len:334 (-),score=17.95 GHVR01009939.1:186-1187(-)
MPAWREPCGVTKSAKVNTPNRQPHPYSGDFWNYNSSGYQNVSVCSMKSNVSDDPLPLTMPHAAVGFPTSPKQPRKMKNTEDVSVPSASSSPLVVSNESPREQSATIEGDNELVANITVKRATPTKELASSFVSFAAGEPVNNNKFESMDSSSFSAVRKLSTTSIFLSKTTGIPNFARKARKNFRAKPHLVAPPGGKFHVEAGTIGWYSWALAGINITGWVRGWVVSREPHVCRLLYLDISNEEREIQVLRVFQKVYSLTFALFHRFWVDEYCPKTILEFPNVAAVFVEKYFSDPPSCSSCESDPGAAWRIPLTIEELDERLRKFEFDAKMKFS